jgi:hypothetical protein
MGQSESYLGRYRAGEWAAVGQEHEHMLEVRHKASGQVCTLLGGDPAAGAGEAKEYTQRLQEYCNIVRVLDIVPAQSCGCGGPNRLSLLLEKISSRLSDYD